MGSRDAITWLRKFIRIRLRFQTVGTITGRTRHLLVVWHWGFAVTISTIARVRTIVPSFRTGHRLAIYRRGRGFILVRQWSAGLPIPIRHAIRQSPAREFRSFRRHVSFVARIRRRATRRVIIRSTAGRHWPRNSSAWGLRRFLRDMLIAPRRLGKPAIPP